jgi:uncharacterized protein YbaR (Trm112 family)
MSNHPGIEDALLEILACPIDKLGLLYFPDERILYNPRLRRTFRIDGGYPVMLADRAEPVPDEEHRRLIKRAACGDAIGTAGTPAKLIAEDAAGQPAGDRKSRLSAQW